MTKAEKPKPCACGCEDVWCVIDCGMFHIECAACNRHTGSYWHGETAVQMWNNDVDIREAGSVKADMRGAEQVRAMGAKGRRF